MKNFFSKKMIICCGTGGVGKTTTAAAIALKAAIEGKKVCLITIDPAKRLATSLGLNALLSDPQDLNNYINECLGITIQGSLSALMLDSQHTFYRFLYSVGGKEVHDRFRENKLFDIIAGNFGGAHEYLAMEKLYELNKLNKYDLLVLDTPPARHTLDFLDAPDTIAHFFDDRVFSWFLIHPQKNTMREKLRAKGAKAAFQILEKLTGKGVINDFISLTPHIYQIKNAFVERQNQVRSLLQSKQAGAIFISSPSHISQGEVQPFLRDAKEKGIALLAFIMNRSLKHIAPTDIPSNLHGIPKELLENYQNLRFLVQEEEKNFKLLHEMAGDSIPILTVPELEKDVHDIPSLQKLSEHLT